MFCFCKIDIKLYSYMRRETRESKWLVCFSLLVGAPKGAVYTCIICICYKYMLIPSFSSFLALALFVCPCAPRMADQGSNARAFYIYAPRRWRMTFFLVGTLCSRYDDLLVIRDSLANLAGWRDPEYGKGFALRVFSKASWMFFFFVVGGKERTHLYNVTTRRMCVGKLPMMTSISIGCAAYMRGKFVCKSG